ncbi:MAG: hypothetical protein JWN18_514 [Parcubacteria group bacterium]|nr:hypothetical protein [Parcubacteria group bacterium]
MLLRRLQRFEVRLRVCLLEDLFGQIDHRGRDLVVGRDSRDAESIELVKLFGLSDGAFTDAGEVEKLDRRGSALPDRIIDAACRC